MTTPVGSSTSAQAANARRALRVIATVLIIAAALVVVIVLVLADTPWGNEQVRRVLVSQANDRLTGSLAIGALRGNLLSTATFIDVSVIDSARRPVFQARRVRVSYALWPALHGQVVVQELALDTPVVVIDRQPGAKWNFEALLRPPSTPTDTSRHAPTPVFANITIRHGHVLYRVPWSPDSTLGAHARDSAVNFALSNASRWRVVRVPGGFQRVLDVHDLDAVLPSISLAHDGRPITVQIASLAVLAEPYRPPVIDIRSLVATLFVSKDSLWWRGARLRFPASSVSGDGTIGLHRSGLRLDLAGAPIAVADLRWLNPSLPSTGGGALRYAMHLHGDTADFDVSDVDLNFRGAGVSGHAGVTRVSPVGEKAELSVRGADLTIAGLTTDIIHSLAPTLALKRRGTLDGHVALDGTPGALQLDATLRFSDVASGTSHVSAHGVVDLKAGFAAHDLAVTLEPLHVATLAGAGIRVPFGGVVRGTAMLNGALQDGWRVRADLTHADGAARSHLIGDGTYEARGRHITATARLEPLSFVTVGRFAPAAGLRGDVTGSAHVEGTTHDLRFRANLVGMDEGGALTAHGTVVPAGSQSRYDITTTLDALNAHAFSTKAPNLRVTGTVAARGSGLSPATLSTHVLLDLVRSSYDSFFVDRLSARAVAENGLLHIDTLDALAVGARVGVSGSLGLIAGRTGTLHFAAVVDSLARLRKQFGTSDTGHVDAPGVRQRALVRAARVDSARRADAVRIERLALGLPEGVTLAVDSLPPLRRDSMAGRLVASGTLSGNVKRLGVDAEARGEGLVARGSSVRRLAASISSADIRDTDPTIHFRVSGDSIETSSYAFQHAQATGDWRPTAVTGTLDLEQDSVVSYAATASYAHPRPGAHDVRLVALRASIDTIVWQLQHPAALRFDCGAIAIDSFDLRNKAGGRVFADGAVPVTGPLRLAIAVEGVQVSTVLRAMQKDSAFDGIVDLRAHAEGSRVQPNITANTTLRSSHYQGTRAPDVNVGALYHDLRLSLDATADDSTGRRLLVGSASLPTNLSLDSVAGPRRLAGALAADLVLDSVPLGMLPLGTHGIESARGTLAASAHVRGTWSAPAYTGTGALRGGAFTLNETGMQLSDVVADLRFSADTLHLDSLVAHAGGALRAWGTVDMRNPARPYLNFGASGQNVRLMNQLRGLVDADADVYAVGPLDALRVTGRGAMLGGFLALHQFRKDLLRVRPPGDLSFIAVFDTSGPANDSIRQRLARAHKRRVAIIADLSLVVDRGTYFRNRPDANTEFYTGDGEELRVHIDQRSEDEWAVGFVRIGEGVAFFRTRPFTPARGTLTFGPHTNAPGLVQQVGERLLWEPGRGWFPLQLLTGGTSKGPDVGLESGTLFPMRGRELNGYLTLGRASTSLLQQTGSSLSGSESWSGQLSGESGALAHRQQGATALGVVLHDIGTGATKAYGLDALSVAPADVPTELVFGKTGGVRGALVEGGRYLTTDRYVAGELRLTTGIPGFRMAQRFGTAYRFDIGIEPRFLFHAPEELGITHPTVRTGVFGMFLTRFWDF